jgi:predicted RNA-binding Zn ribbon-like protein
MTVRALPARPRIATAADVKLHGGSPSLDLVNTVLWRGTDRVQDVLVDYNALLIWARRAGALSAADASELTRLAAAHPRLAERAHRRVISVRDALHRLFIALGEHRRPAAADLELLKASLVDSIAAATPVDAHGALTWTWEALDLERPLWPLVQDAHGLLTSETVTRVRRCAADECGWLFLDVSKNRSRRWCSMEGCGSRAKMRRHYARTRRRERQQL